MSTEEINLDIQSYSIDDLYTILGLNNQATQVELENIFQSKMAEINKSEFSKENKKSYTEFIKKIYYKLLREIKTRDYGSEFTAKTLEKSNKVTLDNDRYQLLQQPHILQNNSKYLIQPNTEQAQDVFVNHYQKGVINKLRKKTVKQIVSLDTVFRKDYDKTDSCDFTYILPLTVKNVVSMKINSIELPYTWYQFTEKNNKFVIHTLDIVLNGVTVNEQDHIITIPPGNWTNDLLNTEINLFFNQDKPNYPLNLFYFEIKESTGKVYIRLKTANEIYTSLVNNTNQITSITIDGEPTQINEGSSYDTDWAQNWGYLLTNDETYNSSCGNKVMPQETCLATLGFKKPEYAVTFNSVHTFLKYEYRGCVVSESIFGANKYNYFFLSVEDFVGNSKDSIIAGYGDEHYLSKDILGRIQVKFGIFFMNLDDSSDFIYKQRDYFGPVNIEKLRIKILDKYGRIMDINNTDYSLTLEFTQIYS